MAPWVMRSLQGNLCPAKELCTATMEVHLVSSCAVCLSHHQGVCYDLIAVMPINFCKNKQTHVHTYIYIKTHTHTYIHIYTCARIHMHTGTLPNVTPLLPKSHTDVCISNGMAWSPGNTKMYHMDSGLRKLWSFNFDDVSSCLTNRQVCWWTSMTRGWGIPDAMCTDSEGRVWRAGLFGATIVLVGPSHGRERGVAGQ